MRETSQTLGRGLQVLELISKSTASLGVRQIGRELGLGNAIVQRLINTLEERGFIEHVSDTHRYRVGYRSLVLGRSYQYSDALTLEAQSRLLELAQNQGLNGYLGAVRNRRAVYLLSVPSRSRVVLRVDAGETMHFHSTALGKVLLAAAGTDKARTYLGAGPLPALTSCTITDPSALLAAIPQTRRNGYATVLEENLQGIVSVAAPVRDQDGDVVAGLSVAYPLQTMNLEIEEVVELAISASDNVSRSVGCPDDRLRQWSER